MVGVQLQPLLVAAGIYRGNAIEEVVRARTVEARHSASGICGDDTRCERRVSREIPQRHRHVLDDLARDDERAVTRLRLNHRRIAGDEHGLFEGADLEGERGYGSAVSKAHSDAFAFGRLEPDE